MLCGRHTVRQVLLFCTAVPFERHIVGRVVVLRAAWAVRQKMPVKPNIAMLFFRFIRGKSARLTAPTEDFMAIARTVDRRLFFVLNRTFLQIAQAADQRLANGSGVGRAQAAVLVYLGYHDGCTLTELSEGTGRRNAAMTGLIDRMETVDLVIRKQSYGDRRQRTVHLSDAGWKTREAVMADFRDFNTQLTRGLTESETAAVMKFLSQSVGNVRK